MKVCILHVTQTNKWRFEANTRSSGACIQLSPGHSSNFCRRCKCNASVEWLECSSKKLRVSVISGELFRLFCRLVRPLYFWKWKSDETRRSQRAEMIKHALLAAGMMLLSDWLGTTLNIFFQTPHVSGGHAIVLPVKWAGGMSISSSADCLEAIGNVGNQFSF